MLDLRDNSMEKWENVKYWLLIIVGKLMRELEVGIAIGVKRGDFTLQM